MYCSPKQPNFVPSTSQLLFIIWHLCCTLDDANKLVKCREILHGKCGCMVFMHELLTHLNEWDFWYKNSKCIKIILYKALSLCYSGFAQSWKVLDFRGSPWIPFFLEKSWSFCASPWKVLEFSSTLNDVAWKEFFLMLFGCPRQTKNHSSENLKVIYIKYWKLYAIINYQFKTSEMKNVEKLVKQTVQVFKF